MSERGRPSHPDFRAAQGTKCKYCQATLEGAASAAKGLISAEALSPDYFLLCPKCGRGFLMFFDAGPDYPLLQIWQDELPNQGSLKEFLEGKLDELRLATDAARATKH